MIAALISFGLVMAYSAYLSGHFFRNRILQQDILAIAERWSGYAAHVPAGATLLDSFDKEAARDNILAVKLIDANGRNVREEI
ncbi:MAG: hypothetical protein V4691_08165, partial [Pseudomonadota bacterium]